MGDCAQTGPNGPSRRWVGRVRRAAVAGLVVVLVSACTSVGEVGGPVVRVLFEDTFDGPGLDTTAWNTCHWWDDGGCTIETNAELEWYLPSQVDVRDGALVLTAERADTPGADGRIYPYRSGMVTTGPRTAEGGEPRFAFTYGTVEARVRVPEGAGLWSALWLLPASRQARPEIDLFEVVGSRPNELLMHFHPEDPAVPADGAAVTLPADASFTSGWRDVRLDWEPGELRWYVDGELVWTRSGNDIPDEPMYLVANLAVGGVLAGTPDDLAAFPATFELDHVRVSRR